MNTLDEFREKWAGQPATKSESLDQHTLEKIFKKRVNTELKSSMQYFWASLVLQIIVYSLLSHVMIKHFASKEIVLYCLAGIALYLPFTFILLKKFKSIAAHKVSGNKMASLYEYTAYRYQQLLSFFSFKKKYELILIPVSISIGTILSFNLFLPGGVMNHLNGAVVVFILSLLSCAYAIVRENKKSFKTPLEQLRQIMNEFNEGRE
jgi:hypothetical protein